MRAIKALVLLSFPLFFLVVTFSVESQTPPAPPAAQAPPPPAQPKKEMSEEGIPVTHQLTIAKCGTCHKADEKGRLTRISYERTTPEGWQMVIKRMVRLNGLSLTPDEARAIVKYLSASHGLAPEEAKPAAYHVEHRMVDENVPEESVRGACIICHNYGRIISQRRSREEWDLLINMHVGYFPVTEFQGFRRFPPPPGAPPPPPGTDTRHPADKAVDFLARTFPLNTPEWAAWRANLRPPKLEGRWLVTGHQPGRGRVYGELTVEPAGAADEFRTQTRLHYLKDGATATRNGRAVVYTGYAWRGRSQGNGGGDEAREVLHVTRDWSQMEGRWFWGSYEEFGVDVTLRRLGAEPVVLGLDRPALKSPATAEQVRVFGGNLPTDLKSEDLDFGPGITVRRVVSAAADQAVIEVDVVAGAPLGKRDIAVRRSFATGAVTVYDKVDYIKVSPDTGLARLGGVRFPKGLQQFEAVAYNRGPDDKPQTADDLSLGPVEVEWSLDEFPATLDDDDKEFVGAISAGGLFTPAVEGPNPKRRFERNNYGDVWVVATYKPKDAAADAKPLTARSYLVVTVPLYVKWDQPEVAR